MKWWLFLTEGPWTIVVPNSLQLVTTSAPHMSRQSASLKRLHTISVGSVLPTQYCWHDCCSLRCALALVWNGNHLAVLAIKNHSTNSLARWSAGRVFHCWMGRKAKLVGRQSSAWVKSVSDATYWTWKVFCDRLAIGGLGLVWKLSRCKWPWAYNRCQQ